MISVLNDQLTILILGIILGLVIGYFLGIAWLNNQLKQGNFVEYYTKLNEKKNHDINRT